MIPLTLAENAGLNPINIITQMRKLHSEGKRVGLNVMGQGELIDMEEAGII